MEKSVDCLSGWSLCLLRLVIISNTMRWEWLKCEELGVGENGWVGSGQLSGSESRVLKALSFSCCVNWSGGCEDNGLCEESGGSPGNPESWLAPGKSSQSLPSYSPVVQLSSGLRAAAPPESLSECRCSGPSTDRLRESLHFNKVVGAHVRVWEAPVKRTPRHELWEHVEGRVQKWGCLRKSSRLSRYLANHVL